MPKAYHGNAIKTRTLRARLGSLITEEESKLRELEPLERAAAIQIARDNGDNENSPGWQETIAFLVERRMRRQREKVELLYAQLATVVAELSREQKSERVLDTIKELGEWDSMDNLALNRVLKSVVERITITPDQKHKGIYSTELKLIGVDSPLPLIWHRRDGKCGARYPTVNEWIEDMIIEPDEERLVGRYWMVTNKLLARGFYSYLLQFPLDTPQRKLAVALKGNRLRPWYFLTRDTLLKRLHEIGVGADLLTDFDDMYMDHMERERARILMWIETRKAAGLSILVAGGRDRRAPSTPSLESEHTPASP